MAYQVSVLDSGQHLAVEQVAPLRLWRDVCAVIPRSRLEEAMDLMVVAEVAQVAALSSASFVASLPINNIAHDTIGLVLIH